MLKAMLDRSGQLTPQKLIFDPEQRFNMLNNNPKVVRTNKASFVVSPGHYLEWKKNPDRYELNIRKMMLQYLIYFLH